MFDHIAAIITLYKPPEQLGALVATIAAQVQSVIIVDNGRNESLKEQFPDCHWLSNPDNGLAKAQNMGVAYAKTLKADAVLLLDDDSLPAPDMVARLVAAWQDGIAVIAPILEEADGNRPSYIQKHGMMGWKCLQAEGDTSLRDLFYVAASGSLIPMHVLDAVGAFHEPFFIYFLDTDFCLRARQLGYDIAVAPNAVMQHHFGAVTHHKLFGKQVRTTNHSATARYWMWRNRTSLWARYALKEPGYVVFDIARGLSELVRVLCFEQERGTKLKAMLCGLLRLQPRH